MHVYRPSNIDPVIQFKELESGSSYTTFIIQTNSEVGLDRDLDLTGRDNAALALECGWIHMVVTGPSTDTTDKNLGRARARVVLQLPGFLQCCQTSFARLCTIQNDSYTHSQAATLNSHQRPPSA